MCCCHYAMWNDSQVPYFVLLKCTKPPLPPQQYNQYKTPPEVYNCVFVGSCRNCMHSRITLTEWQTSVSQGLQKNRSLSGSEKCVMVRGWGPYAQMQSPPSSSMQEYEFIGLPGLEDWEVLSMITLKHSKESQELNSAKASRCNSLIGSFFHVFFHSFIQRVIWLSFTELNKTSPYAWEVCYLVGVQTKD